MSGQKELSPMDNRKLNSFAGVSSDDVSALRIMKQIEREKRSNGLLHRLVLKNGSIVDTTRPEWFQVALKRYHQQFYEV